MNGPRKSPAPPPPPRPPFAQLTPPAMPHAGPMPVDDGGIARLIEALRGAQGLLSPATPPLLCPGCDSPAALTARYCPACGGRLRILCPLCHAGCRTGDGHCHACGAALEADAVDDALARSEAEEQEARARRAGPLDAYEHTVTLGGRRLTKVQATRPDGSRCFVKLASSAADRQLLENEVAVLGLVQSPHLIRLEGTRQWFEQLVAEFEWIDAQPLEFPLSMEKLARLMMGVAHGLAALHGAGWVHGDLKPQNILLGPTGEPLLIDLETAQRKGRSRFGAYTPMFAAPEQVFGEELDARADVYAFGVTLYLLFTYDRFPALLDPTSQAHEQLGRVVGSVPKKKMAHLSSQTVLVNQQPMKNMPQQLGPPRALPTTPQILGTKYLFAAELERLATINRRLDLTGDILALVSDCTAVDPDLRPADGTALVERLGRLLRRVTP